MHRIKASGCAALLAGASACVQPTHPAGLAKAEHSLFWNLGDATVILPLTAEGAAWSSGAVDPVLYPLLAEAWAAGARPAMPLYGRDHAMWLRALRVTPLTAAADNVRLEAKALAPYPICLSLLIEENGELVPLGSCNSEMWSLGKHFARVDLPHPTRADTVVVVRVEGGHQAFESRLRLLRAP
jgi:hypothetical protein